MDRLKTGVLKFQREVYPKRKALFEQLAGKQHPHSLFITCADSRIVPDLLTQSNPGDLFICRNAGNMVPPHGDVHGGIAATIDYAVSVLNVEDIIVCGHTDCGAMKGILHPELLDELPTVKSWIGHGNLARQVVKENYPDLEGDDLLKAITEENVVAQLLHLRTFTSIEAKLGSGKIQLNGWVYNIASGDVRVWDADRNGFVSIGEYDSEPKTEKSRMVAAL